MSALAILSFLALGTMLQQALPLWPRFGQAPFPVLLALTIYYALHRPLPAALATAVAAGLLQDAPGLMPLGYSSVCFALIALLINRYRDEVFVFEGMTQAVFGGVATMMVTLMLYAILLGSDYAPLPAGRLLLKLVGAALLGVLTTPVVHLAARRFDDLLGLAEDRPLS